MVNAQADSNVAAMADVLTASLPQAPPPQPFSWPALREDLALFQGPQAYDGSPTWNLYDPLVHRYFRIGWLEFECLQHWELGDPQAVASAIVSSTPLDVDVDDVKAVCQFLQRCQLIKPQGSETSKRFAETRHNNKPGFWTWLLHNYLFLRIPLLKPDRYLKKALPYLNFIFGRNFFLVLCLGILFAVYLVSQRWSSFTHNFEATFTPEGMLATLGMLSVSKVFHELGHALTAKRLGCRVPAMGVALLLGMPVLWTDVTDAWRLPRRRDRLLIDAAGMLAELSLAVAGTLLWVVLPEGPWRSGAYVLASSAWLITLGINLNPFMRFDGYYLLADALDIPNMQDRAFTLALWQLRESLFGFGIAPPECWPKGRKRFLIAYAYSIWIYRLILFTGIAWAVYYFFFKILGLFLFAVEIGWFIVRPVVNEIKTWRKLLKETATPIRPRRAWLVPLALLALLFIPWRSQLIVPGLLVAESEFTFYCVEPAQVQEVLVKDNDFVQAGQTIAILVSPDLDYQILDAELKLKEMQARLASYSLELKLARTNPIDFEELQSTQAELTGYLELKQKLTLRAPIAGTIRDVSDFLRPGEWIAKDEPLGIVESPAKSVIAYVEEADLTKLNVNGEGRFYPEGGDMSPFPVVITAIDKTGARELKVSELASAYGGEIAVRQDTEKSLIPELGIYRVLTHVQAAELQQKSSVRGRLSLDTPAESLAARFTRISIAALIRESGW
jgi:putative peptide zinc metalloprotease protein